VLYGLDKAKDKIRRRGYAVLVEGQMDLVLSHQAGIDNTVASSGTAFTEAHLLRLKRLSQNLLLAFDGDEAGLKAAEKSAALAFSLGFEVKIAVMPEGRDPADLVKESPEKWKDALRASKGAIEVFLQEILKEKDRAKVGKLIERKLVPLIALMQSQLDKEHAISLISRYSGKSPQALAEEVAKAKKAGTSRVLLENSSDVARDEHGQNFLPASDSSLKTRREALEDRLNEVRTWQKELAEDAPESLLLKKEEAELKNHLTHELIKDELASLSVVLAAAETSNDSESLQEAMLKIKELHREMRALEESRNVL
jgi:DNA primase